MSNSRKTLRLITQVVHEECYKLKYAALKDKHRMGGMGSLSIN